MGMDLGAGFAARVVHFTVQYLFRDLQGPGTSMGGQCFRHTSVANRTRLHIVFEVLQSFLSIAVRRTGAPNRDTR